MTTLQEHFCVAGTIQIFPKPINKDIVRVILVLEDGTEYPITHKGAGVDLIDHVGANVEVNCVFEESPDFEGGKVLRVRSYTLTDEDDYPWFDEG